jgi:hypothetical protein
VSVLLGQGDGTFQDARALLAGNSPVALAVGDFNGDGIPDLAVANEFDRTVSVLLGQGDGTFKSAGNLAVGTNPVSVAVEDLNGDGVPDLAVANQGIYPAVGESVSVLLGNGDGTFQPAQDFAAGHSPSAVVVADFNGDGIPDLAIANAAFYTGAATVSVLVGSGDGSFQAPQNFAVGAAPQALAAGDFNGDNIPDLAVANYSSDNVSVLRGQGDGTFSATPSFPAGRNPFSEVVGDFNGDGIPDLAIANFYSGTISVLLGNGDGTFGDARSFSVGGYPEVVAVGDFNDDGNVDLVVDIESYPDSPLKLLLGNGDGTFQPARTIVGGGPHSVVVGDFNGDGLLDLAIAPALGSTVTIYLGVGDGTFQAAGTFGIGTRPSTLAVGDFNGDGIPDLVAVDEGPHGVEPSVTVLLGNGDGSFGNAHSFEPWLNPLSVAVGDFNGDGLDDLAVTGDDLAGPPGVKVLLSAGDGTFRNASLIPIGPNPGRVVTADFNNDGIPDLVVAYRGHVRVLLGAGDATFQRPFSSYIAGTSTSPLVVADFNGDGLPDLAASDAPSDSVAILLNDGNWPSGPGGGGPGRSAPPGGKPVRLDVLAVLSAALSPSRASFFSPSPASAPAEGTLPGPEVAVVDRLFASPSKRDAGILFSQLIRDHRVEAEYWAIHALLGAEPLFF